MSESMDREVVDEWVGRLMVGWMNQWTDGGNPYLFLRYSPR